MHITTSEWQIMRIVWTKKAITSKELYDILKDQIDWQPTTIKTLLKRLVDKQCLQTQKVGNKFIYTAMVSEDMSFHYISDELLSRICATKVSHLLCEIIEKSDLTQTDIDLLQSALLSKQVVDTISCNCLKGQCHCENCQKGGHTHGKEVSN